MQARALTQFGLGPKPMAVCIAFGSPFLFPIAARQLRDLFARGWDAVRRSRQDSIGLAPGNAHAGNVTVTAGILAKGIIDRLSRRQRRIAGMTAAADRITAIFRREANLRVFGKPVHPPSLIAAAT